MYPPLRRPCVCPLFATDYILLQTRNFVRCADFLQSAHFCQRHGVGGQCLLCQLLQQIQPLVQAALDLHQLLVRPRFRDAAMVEHDDGIGVADG